MAKNDTNDPPPPYYSVVVHPQPPLKPYEKIVHNGGGPGMSPPNQLYFVPQYPPPVGTLTITQPSKPPSRKSRCCGNDSKCYGSSGATVLLLILLALAIWLGVRYGTRLTAVGDLYDNEYGDGMDGGDYSMPNNDICSNATVQCDAIRDCQLGSDENNCVRFAGSGSLQVRTAQDGRFLPVCFQGFDQSYADQTCAQLGFRKSYVTKAVSSQDSTGLMLTSRSSLPIQGLVNVSSSCPDQRTVSLQCVECGQQQSTSRIIGGSVAKEGQWPWQLSLHFRGFHTCGGVLISRDFVLTAAHCFPRSTPSALNPRNWQVYGGTVSLDQLPQPFRVEKILLSENYNNKTNDQDIALLKLTAPVDFSNVVKPACLPAFDKRFPHGTKCWTSGYGTTEEGAGRGSRDLMEVTIDIISARVCNSSQVYGGSVSKHMLCAGDLNGGKDSCQGDSGGPLVCQDSDKRWYLVGITSWGAGCGRSYKPGVYTKVTSLLPWIHSKMQQERP